MKKFSLFLIVALILALTLTGCTITVKGKKVFDNNGSFSVGGVSSEKTEEKDITLNGQKRLAVSNAVGRVILTPWDKDYIHIKAVKKLKSGGSKEKQGEMLDQIEIKAQPSSDAIDISVKYINGLWGFSSQSVDMEIMVPSGVNYIDGSSASGSISLSGFNNLERVELKSVSGRVEVSNTTATAIELGTTSGRLTADTLKGSGNIHSISGSIDLKGIVGDIECTTTSGSITARALEGSVSSSSVSGRVDMECVYLKSSSSFSTTSGLIDVTAEKIDNAGEYQLSSVSGGIRLSLPENSNFTIAAKSTSGHVREEFGVVEDGSNRDKEIRGAVGSGGAHFNIHTTSGGITVQKN